jgi:hypothetical protein
MGICVERGNSWLAGEKSRAGKIVVFFHRAGVNRVPDLTEPAARTHGVNSRSSIYCICPTDSGVTECDSTSLFKQRSTSACTSIWNLVTI